MRGFIKISNRLDAISYEESYEEMVYIDIKLKMCDILDQLLGTI
jgi:hypothetical protein